MDNLSLLKHMQFFGCSTNFCQQFSNQLTNKSAGHFEQMSTDKTGVHTGQFASSDAKTHTRRHTHTHLF